MKTVLIIALSVCMSFCQNQRIQRIIRYINAIRTPWEAGSNYLIHWPKERIKKLLGVRLDSNSCQLPAKNISSLPSLINLPSNFDARKKWPNCDTIRTIRDQGACGSCWAMSAVSTMSDRMCIETRGKESLNMSVQNLLACCSTCGNGCNGGSPPDAWQYWIQNGIVSGGDYNSKKGCQPYTRDAYIDGITPTCTNQCQKDFIINYKDDLRNGSTAYSVPNSTVAIKIEIFQHGPVQATMIVFEDFITYKKGIYKHITGIRLGPHAVKILGWGIEKNMPYWLVANSWGKNWGIKGFFKIIQGAEDTNIEANVIAGSK